MNDAIGGATSGTLNLTQTAIGGGNGGGGNVGKGGDAVSTLIGTNPFGSSTYNLTANAIGGDTIVGYQEVAQPQRLTRELPIAV